MVTCGCRRIFQLIGGGVIIVRGGVVGSLIFTNLGGGVNKLKSIVKI